MSEAGSSKVLGMWEVMDRFTFKSYSSVALFLDIRKIKMYFLTRIHTKKMHEMYIKV